VIDFQNPAWSAIKDWATKELQRCREKNDAALSLEETAKLRGKIEALKELLALPAKAAAQASMSRLDQDV
jgi:hypothetical protein